MHLGGDEPFLSCHIHPAMISDMVLVQRMRCRPCWVIEFLFDMHCKVQALQGTCRMARHLDVGLKTIFTAIYLDPFPCTVGSRLTIDPRMDVNGAPSQPLKTSTSRHPVHLTMQAPTLLCPSKHSHAKQRVHLTHRYLFCAFVPCLYSFEQHG